MSSSKNDPLLVYEGRTLMLRFDENRVGDIERILGSFLEGAGADETIRTTIEGDVVTVQLLRSYAV